MLTSIIIIIMLVDALIGGFLIKNLYIIFIILFIIFLSSCSNNETISKPNNDIIIDTAEIEDEKEAVIIDIPKYEDKPEEIVENEIINDKVDDIIPDEVIENEIEELSNKPINENNLIIKIREIYDVNNILNINSFNVNNSSIIDYSEEEQYAIVSSPWDSYNLYKINISNNTTLAQLNLSEIYSDNRIYLKQTKNLFFVLSNETFYIYDKKTFDYIGKIENERFNYLSSISPNEENIFFYKSNSSRDDFPEREYYIYNIKNKTAKLLDIKLGNDEYVYGYSFWAGDDYISFNVCDKKSDYYNNNLKSDEQTFKNYLININDNSITFIADNAHEQTSMQICGNFFTHQTPSTFTLFNILTSEIKSYKITDKISSYLPFIGNNYVDSTGENLITTWGYDNGKNLELIIYNFEKEKVIYRDLLNLISEEELEKYTQFMLDSNILKFENDKYYLFYANDFGSEENTFEYRFCKYYELVITE